MLQIRIDEILEKRGLTAYWLAKATNINHATLSQIRRNKNKAINLEFFDRICEVLNCEPGDLLIRVPTKKAEKKEPTE